MMHILHAPSLRVLCNSAINNPLTILRSSTALTQSSQPYTTSPKIPSTQTCTSLRPLHRTYFSTTLPMIPTRHASTTTEPPSVAPQASLNWNEFLRLRRIRRYYNLGGSVFTGVSGVFVGAGILANNDIASIGQQMTGLDPFIIMGAWVLGFGGTGWLMGPVIGTTIFGMIYRRFGGQMRSVSHDTLQGCHSG